MATKSLEYYLVKYNNKPTSETAKSVIRYFQNQKVNLSLKTNKTGSEKRRLGDLIDLSKFLGL